ncbi:MAG: hypothetical protein HN521_07765 [Candidatus Latescibacteria bacterium]|jgi:hypothetical protein|nr:hypothetical protein [Candidatus Latescibacterota bacterium]
MTGHRLLGYLLFFIWLVVTVSVGIEGWAYYQLPLIDRPLDVGHKMLKPGGFYGHGLGVAGASMIVFGVLMYMVRKRVRWMMDWGNLRVWLTVHIFLCVMGATLVTFHTAFKVGGLVAVSFWCMIGVVLSGVLGRYVYVRIPRDLGGRAVTAAHLETEYQNICDHLSERLGKEHQAVGMLADISRSQHAGPLALLVSDLTRFFHMRQVRNVLKMDMRLSAAHFGQIIQLAKKQASLQRSIHFYQTLQNVLHYWHVIHLPFTVVMFLIMIVHIAVAILFGHRWVF